MQSSVIPAIIPQSLAHVHAEVAKIASVASEIQIDIVDGVFAQEAGWPHNTPAALGGGGVTAAITALPDVLPHDMSFELDLMIARPLETLSAWLAVHPGRVVLHIESFQSDAEMTTALGMIRDVGSMAVLAALNDTPLARLIHCAADADAFQCMGIAEIGRQGNPFDTRVLARIAALHEAYPIRPISVDGSVNKDTIMSLRDAGATRFVVGSALFTTADPARTYTELVALVNSERGLPAG